jgi:hypothetical protein
MVPTVASFNVLPKYLLSETGKLLQRIEATVGIVGAENGKSDVSNKKQECHYCTLHSRNV